MRIGRGVYLLGWMALTAVQVALTISALPFGIGTALSAVVVMQLIKTPWAAGRLRDLGAPPDDAIMGLLPLANIGLFTNKLMKKTPTPERWATRVERWSSQPTASDLVLSGARRYATVLPLSLPLVALFAGINTWGFTQSMGILTILQGMDPATLEMLRQASVALTGALALYTVLQIMKRHRVSRRSWVPSLLLLPVSFLAILCSMGTSLGPVALMLQSVAWDLLWEIFAGSLLSLFWISWAFDMHEGVTPSYRSAFARINGRWMDVAAAYGGATLSIWAGLQVIIPGIYYAVSYAMIDIVAFDDPDQRAFARSTALVRGIRRRVLKVLVMVLLVSVSAQFTSIVLIDGIGVVGQMVSDPSAVSWRASLPGDVVAVILWGVIKFAMVDLYFDRKARLANG